MKPWVKLVLFICVFCTTLAGVSAETVLHQPGPETGKDAGAYDSDAIYYYQVPQYTVLAVSNCNQANAHGYIQFDLRGLPSENIISAEVLLYTQVFFNGAGWPWTIDPTIAVREVTSTWDETTLNWNNQPSYKPTVLDSHTINTVGGGSSNNPYYEYDGWLSYDITDLYTDWAKGSKPNYGIRISSDVPSCLNGDLIWYYTSDYDSDTSLRPKLVITHQTSPTTTSQITTPVTTVPYPVTQPVTTKTSPVTIQTSGPAKKPDLIVTAADVPPSARPGEKINIVDVIRNQGDGDIRSVYTMYFLSTNNQESRGGILLQGDQHTIALLPAGAENQGFITVTIPADIKPGTYYLRVNVFANAKDNLAEESNIWNNYLFATSPMVITTSGTGNTASDSLQSGSGSSQQTIPASGKYTSLDALTALQMSVGKRASDLSYDIVNDGKIDSKDAREILRLAVGS